MPISLSSLNTVAGNVYVSTGNSAITFLSLCNYSMANVTANVYVVPAGDIASNNNVVISNIEIAAQDTYQFYVGGEKLLLSTNDSVVANASSSDSITTVTSFTTV
jgi:hypothetical protein